MPMVFTAWIFSLIPSFITSFSLIIPIASPFRAIAIGVSPAEAMPFTVGSKSAGTEATESLIESGAPFVMSSSTEPLSPSFPLANFLLNLILASPDLSAFAGTKPIPRIIFTPLVRVLAENSWTSESASMLSSRGTKPRS